MYAETIHSKNSRVRIDPDLVPRGPDPFLGQFDPESVSICPGIQSKSPLLTKFLVTMTRIPGHIDTDSGLNWRRNGSGPLGPKSGSILTWVSLGCRQTLCLSIEQWTVPCSTMVCLNCIWMVPLTAMGKVDETHISPPQINETLPKQAWYSSYFRPSMFSESFCPLKIRKMLMSLKTMNSLPELIQPCVHVGQSASI